ncbi:MAG: TraB/GumN family protein [Parashewanella sp.]
MFSCRKTLLSFILLCCFFSSAQARESDRPPFFKVEYQGKTAYLLGTIHAGKADFYPLPNMIEKQFALSSHLVIEAIPNPSDAQLVKTLPALKDKNAAVIRQYHAYCADKTYFCNALAAVPPWIKAMQIVLLRLQTQGFQPQHGVEYYLLSKRQGKKLKQLESSKQQLQLMNSLSAASQWNMLSHAMSASNSEITELFQAWRTGNLSMIDAISKKESDTAAGKEFIRVMLWQRNKAMAEKIKRLLQQASANDSTLKNNYFVAIGAAHLVGERSVNDYLTQSGAKITNCWQSTTLCQ